MTILNRYPRRFILLLLILIVFTSGIVFGLSIVEEKYTNEAVAQTSGPNEATTGTVAQQTSGPNEATTRAVVQTNGLYVATNGSDSNPGTFNEPWRTLRYALPRLNPGDTLYIRGGTYNLNSIDLDEDNTGTSANPILVSAYQGEEVTLANSQIRFFGANWWTLDGLNFDPVTNHVIVIGEGGSATGQSRVLVAHHITIQNCEFRNGNREGISIKNADDILIDNSYFFNLRSGSSGVDLNGVDLYWRAHRITIQNSRFHNIGSDGIHIGTFYFKSGADITDIAILDNEFWVDRPYSGPFGNVGENGVDIKGSPGPTLVSGNVFHGFRRSVSGQDGSGSPGEAMVLHWASSGGQGVSNAIIEKNEFYDNTIHLIVAHNNSDIKIRNNIFRDSFEDTTMSEGGAAISWYDNSHNIDILYNTFERNRYHIHSFTGTDVSGEIKNNGFIDGGFYAPTHANAQFDSDYNTFGGVIGSIPTILTGPNDTYLD